MATMRYWLTAARGRDRLLVTVMDVARGQKVFDHQRRLFRETVGL
jgi:hypothetical protein